MMEKQRIMPMQCANILVENLNLDNIFLFLKGSIVTMPFRKFRRPSQLRLSPEPSTRDQGRAVFLRYPPSWPCREFNLYQARCQSSVILRSLRSLRSRPARPYQLRFPLRSYRFVLPVPLQRYTYAPYSCGAPYRNADVNPLPESPYP